jgi:hypothetical protein
MLVPLGLTRSNEAATRETCRGHNEPRRRAKALHIPPYSSSLETQAPSNENKSPGRDGPCGRWYWQADAGASSTLCASQLQLEPHQAGLACAETTRSRSFRSPSSTELIAIVPTSFRTGDISRARRRPGHGQVVARRRSAPWLSRRVGHYHQRLRSGRPPRPTPPGLEAASLAIRTQKSSREPVAAPVATRAFIPRGTSLPHGRRT